MSNHRFNLKIEFSIYGQNYEWDTSLNWNHEDQSGCDPRIIEWFANCYTDARAGWDHQNMVEDEAKERARVEINERAELQRLKAKYEPDADASTEDFDRWAQTFDPAPNPLITNVQVFDDFVSDPQSLTGPWGRMNVVDGSSVRWIDPTPVGDFSTTGITCRVCSHRVAMKAGDVIQSGDPRLCVHLGGPDPSKWDGFTPNVSDIGPVNDEYFRDREQGPTQQ